MTKIKKGSLIYQAKKRFRELDAIGESKPKNSQKIHSYGTMKTYLKHSLDFVTYCREKYKIKDLEKCKPYVKEWIEGNNYSPWVKKTQRSALAKMYGVSAPELGQIDTGHRSRATVKRSRGKAIRDKHFSETGKYKDYVTFCKSTGLRKNEVENLEGRAFFKDNEGNAFLKVTKGTKGGRYRVVPIIENVGFIEKICREAGDGKVIPLIAKDRLKAPSGADTHSYRAIYARNLYDANKMKLETLPRAQKYYCRKDLKGVIYDKKAMSIVSQALGHTRLSVIAISYLHANCS